MNSKSTRTEKETKDLIDKETKDLIDEVFADPEVVETVVEVVEPVVKVVYDQKPANVPTAISEAKTKLDFIKRYRGANDYDKNSIRSYLDVPNMATERDVIFAYLKQK